MYWRAGRQGGQRHRPRPMRGPRCNAGASGRAPHREHGRPSHHSAPLRSRGAFVLTRLGTVNRSGALAGAARRPGARVGLPPVDGGRLRPIATDLLRSVPQASGRRKAADRAEISARREAIRRARQAPERRPRTGGDDVGNPPTSSGGAEAGWRERMRPKSERETVVPCARTCQIRLAAEPHPRLATRVAANGDGSSCATSSSPADATS